MNMKNKKGFTLIELLAVIAILAILLVIAVPQVLSLFQSSRKSAFVSQAQAIYKAVEQNYVSSQISGTSPINSYYSDADSQIVTQSKLDLDGTDDVAYCVKISADGAITYFHISNSNYNIEIPANANGISISDIDEDDIATATDDNKVKSCN